MSRGAKEMFRVAADSPWLTDIIDLLMWGIPISHGCKPLVTLPQYCAFRVPIGNCFRSSSTYSTSPRSRRFASKAFLDAKTPAWPYIYRAKASEAMAPQLDAYFKQVDTDAEHFIERLRKAVAIPSVSADGERRPDVVKV